MIYIIKDILYKSNPTFEYHFKEKFLNGHLIYDIQGLTSNYIVAPSPESYTERLIKGTFTVLPPNHNSFSFSAIITGRWK
ncbi:hypothetical protein [Fusobacterium mortiferum]|uniref:Uncharacterized protein n=1 Tax=Fusobacterium mortiferum TaxID=850 RepID=A0ABS2G5N4_FUSMR|nr:hypothetical protein [Fusobacterium mortiferum]MBM6876019.1 hypothetical protein [Fusobacterium mortiferum]